MTTKSTLLVIAVIVVTLSILFQLGQLYQFVNAGARFTAKDGQELCERIRTLERGLSLPAPACHYSP